MNLEELNDVERIRSFDNGTANATGMVNGSPVFMFRVGGEVLLPIVPGQGFGLSIRNETEAARAFPAVFGNGKDWRNVYIDCHIVDPTLMPSKGGMWEVQGYAELMLDAIALPGGLRRPFVAAASGLGYEDLGADRLVVWERPPVDPNATIEEPSHEDPGYTTRGDATIDVDAVQNGGRFETGVAYQPTVTELARVCIVTRDELSTLAHERGFQVDAWHATGYDGEWADINIRDLTV